MQVSTQTKTRWIVMLCALVALVMVTTQLGPSFVAASLGVDGISGAPALQATLTPAPRDASATFKLISNTYLKIDTTLRHRPAGDPLSPKIAKGQTVALMGKATDNKGQWWYRVAWSSPQGDYVGWIDANWTDFPHDKLAVLRPPPPCARFLTAVTGAKKWTNSKEQDLVVLADLYRRKPEGKYPVAKFKVTVGGEQKDRWSRPIKPTNGQLLLGRGTAINMGPIKANSVLGYALETTVKEPVMLFTAIFAVPDGCEFESNS